LFKNDVVRSENLIAVIVKNTAFWNVTPCSLVDHYQCFRGTCYLYLQGRRVLYLGDGGAGNFKMLVINLPDYMVVHPKRQSSYKLFYGEFCGLKHAALQPNHNQSHSSTAKDKNASISFMYLFSFVDITIMPVAQTV
jgi:hypothetical protein